MTLIKEPTKINTNQPKPNQGDLNYLENSTNPLASSARQKLNKWFANIPTKNQRGLKTRFKDDFNSAFFELFIHELFLKLQCTLTEHPHIKETNTHPDYLVVNGNEQFYLECKKFENLSDEKAKLQKVENDILCNLSTLKSKYYLCHINRLYIASEYIPDLTAYYSALQNKLNLAPPSNANINTFKVTIDKIDSESFSLEIELSLRADWKTGIERDELLGTHTGNTMIGLPLDSLVRGIERKMTRYGKTNHPLVIAQNIDHWRYWNKLDYEDIFFYGSGVYNRVTQSSYRDNDGLFIKDPAQYDHVAGVLIVCRANPYNNSTVKSYFFKNPNFKGLVEIMETFTTAEYKNGDIIYQDGKSISEIILEND